MEVTTNIVVIPLSEELFMLIGAGIMRFFTWADLQIANACGFSEAY